MRKLSEIILRLRMMFDKLRESILINNLSCRVMFFVREFNYVVMA